MTLEQLKQKLALDELVKRGVGLVSPKTYDEILSLTWPDPVPTKELVGPQHISDVKVCGIRLIKNPFIPDGEIWPFQEWGDFEPLKIMPPMTTL